MTSRLDQESSSTRLETYLSTSDIAQLQSLEAAAALFQHNDLERMLAPEFQTADDVWYLDVSIGLFCIVFRKYIDRNGSQVRARLLACSIQTGFVWARTPVGDALVDRYYIFAVTNCI